MTSAQVVETSVTATVLDDHTTRTTVHVTTPGFKLFTTLTVNRQTACIATNCHKKYVTTCLDSLLFCRFGK